MGGSTDGLTVENVEIVSLDPIYSPVPDCLKELNQFPIYTLGSAGALDYAGNGIYSKY